MRNSISSSFMNRFILSLSMLLVVLPIIAQIGVPLTKEANFYRQGDMLYKVAIEYVDPGARGKSQTWSIRKIPDEVRDCIHSIRVSNDTVAICVQDVILNYMLQGDTLFETAVQGRRSYSLLEQKKPIIKYPFHYGDSISGFYSGFEKDEYIGASILGWGYSVIDGLGIITDGVDTLYNIVRLKRQDFYSMLSPTWGVSSFQQTQHLWYSSGYRYPVMESIMKNVLYDSVYYPIDSVSYLYLPQMQDGLAYDVVNDSIRKKLEMVSRACIDTEDGTLSSALSFAKAVLSADGSILNITYKLERLCSLDFCACDIIGNILADIHLDSQSAGIWNEKLDLSRIPFGRTLFLNIKCGEETKIIKVYE